MNNIFPLIINDQKDIRYDAQRSDDLKAIADFRFSIRKAQTGKVRVSPSKLQDCPIVVCDGTGYLHRHANEYIISIQSTVSSVTLNNVADHLRYWLNICANLGQSYLQVDLSFFNKVLGVMRKNGTEESSIVKYVGTWRLFYAYLHSINTDCYLILPPKIEKKRDKTHAQDSGDILNYTKRSRTTTYNDDPVIENRRLKRVKDYSSQVLTMEELRELVSELRKNDAVYGVMAKVQFDTLMRINELVHYFPYEKNENNPNFIIYGQMVLQNLESQPLHFIGKGNKERTLDLDIETLKLIEQEYISKKEPDSDLTLYSERKKLFRNNYLSSKDGKRSEYKHDSDVLWLAKSGWPVSVGMYQTAFRAAVAKLCERKAISNLVRARPHSMRHTGATLRLIKYRDETGIHIDIKNLGDIHNFLQNLLGHEDFETTELYIKTVTKLVTGLLAKKTIIRNEKVWEKELSENPVLQKGVNIIKNQ